MFEERTYLYFVSQNTVPVGRDVTEPILMVFSVTQNIDFLQTKSINSVDIFYETNKYRDNKTCYENNKYRDNAPKLLVVAAKLYTL